MVARRANPCPLSSRGWLALGLLVLGAGCRAGGERPADAGVLDVRLDASLVPEAAISLDRKPETSPPQAAYAQVPLLVRNLGAFLQVSFDGKGPFLLRYDTGSPTSYLDRDKATASGLSGGSADAAIEGVAIGKRMVTLIDWIEADVTYAGMPGPIVGLLGNDFFAGHAVGLDCAGGQLWLYRDPPAEATLVLPDDADPALGTQASFSPTKGYLLVPCSFGGAAHLGDCLFDTGAMWSLAYASYWEQFSHPSSKQVPYLTVDNQGNPLLGYYQRAAWAEMGELRVQGPVVAVIKDFALLTAVGTQIGHSLVGLIGFETTLRHFSVVDYVNNRLAFFPRADLSHLPESPFVGFGFITRSAANLTLEVVAVAKGSSAEAAGVLPGDLLTAVDGKPLGSVGLDFTVAAIIAGKPGEARSFRFLRPGAGGATLELEIRAEDLLPAVTP